MSEDIAKRLKLEIDTKEKHDLRGIATSPIESLGIVRNVPVNFAPRCTIYADFAVVKYPKLMLILPNTLLDKYNYDLLASKRELRLECNGKEFFIPINMHKVKNKLEVNCATTTSECVDLLAPDKVSQNPQDISEDETLKKKVSYRELEKMLYTTLKYNAEINEYCERLQTCYDELLRK
ncbi:hypothetical protein RclHR1_01840027 [Rhizophagus clarus]|uniref:Aspartic peptidase DDI1-type domain-containing protein n=1 Tax=Rhizophagus clarus TaxID=94130 RepID=A0A2Z6QME6_9GLOM|nr:hypothetical protein RclHR1_01840027 [Rhizophagus clarus]GET02585.1 hypothetical protein GLOIN_2v1780336 [Rhizophagus clarus]